MPALQCDKFPRFHVVMSEVLLSSAGLGDYQGPFFESVPYIPEEKTEHRLVNI